MGAIFEGATVTAASAGTQYAIPVALSIINFIISGSPDPHMRKATTESVNPHFVESAAVVPGWPPDRLNLGLCIST